MKTKEIITKVKVIKESIGEQHDEWVELNKGIKLSGNYGHEAVDRAFVDLEAAIDYLIFSIKG